MLRALALAAAGLLLASARPAPPESVRLVATPVPLNSVDPAQTETGRLRFMGGVSLSSTDRRFGGLSGMRFLSDGRLLAISDSGDWLEFRPVERDGHLVGAEDLRISRLTDPEGQPLRGKVNSDSESLEIEADGTRLVSFERTHRVMAYTPGDPDARPLRFPDQMWLSRLPTNSGLETIARVGRLRLFISEDVGPGGINMILEPVDRSGTYGRALYEAPAGYRPTDASALDDHTVLILNRSYSPLSGVAAILNRVVVDPDKLTASHPERIAELAPPLTVDNMEALAVRHIGGRTYVYMASDDNFSPLQRTLLLKFELIQ